MTNFLFIRHGAHDLLGHRIAGRQEGVHLNAAGVEQARHLAQRVSLLPIDAVFTGPLERVRETAAPLAAHFDLPLQVAEEFNELDCGEWTDCTFADLQELPAWRHYNTFRSSTAVPKGELMLEVQVRVVRKLAELRGRYEFVAVVTHGDVVRAAVAHYLGLHLDHLLRLEIDPASLSLVEVGNDFAHVRLLNAPCAGSPLELPPVRHV